MTKSEFIEEFLKKAELLPKEEKRKSLLYYSEMIDDKIEDGMSEEEAVASLGSIDALVDGVIGDMTMSNAVKTSINRVKKNVPKGILVTVLIILGSPVWFSLLIAAVCVLFSLIVSIWAVAVALCASVFALGISAVALLAVSVIRFFSLGAVSGVYVLGASLIVAGISMLIFVPVKHLCVGCFKLSAWFAGAIKRLFVKGFNGNKAGESK